MKRSFCILAATVLLGIAGCDKSGSSASNTTPAATQGMKDPDEGERLETINKLEKKYGEKSN